MKITLLFSSLAVLLAGSAAAQAPQPIIPPGKIAVFKAGTSDNQWPMVTARVAPSFVQIFDPTIVNQPAPLLSVALSTNESVPGSVWINPHAGSEGGGLSRSTDRGVLALEGYTGNILSPTAAKPSTDFTVARGIVTLDSFTNAVNVYSDLANWFGIPAGSVAGTQDNPTGIATTDGTNFWGTGNFAGTSSELDGTLFYNASVSPEPFEIQNYIQAASQARVIGGTLYVVVPGAGVYNFLDPRTGNIVPLPYDPNVPTPYQSPAFTNLFFSWGSAFKKVGGFDMNAAGTIAYGADQTFGIVKFTNNGGVWTQAPYIFGSTNIGTLNQASGNQGCFGICVDFTGANPVIYATTMENGYPIVNTAQGHQNQNRLIKIVDAGVAPGTNLVAQTLAVAATTNEFFGGIDFSPDLRPLITADPAGYATTNGGAATFSVTSQALYPVSYQWLQNSNAIPGATNRPLTLGNLNAGNDGFSIQCVVSDQYGSVTSAPALLTITASATLPLFVNRTNTLTGYVGGTVTFPAVSVGGTAPFTYQWSQGVFTLRDGAKYQGSTAASLTISNLTVADAGNYFMNVGNPGGFAGNLVDILTVKYHTAIINAGQPQPVTTFAGLSTSLTAAEMGAAEPVTNQWYRGAAALADTGDFSGSHTSTLTISPAAIADSGTNYYLVVSNPGGSVTSSVAAVSIVAAPPLSAVGYSNQVYTQTFDSLPDPGGASVNSLNNPLDPGMINGVAYSLANPFDFSYPVINNSYVGGLGLPKMQGWYGAADTLFQGVDGISRFGAQMGDQSTGGVIDFGPNDLNGGAAGTNRALGLISTSTTGSTAFALKLINQSTNILSRINLSFLGELWRNNTGARTISFGYSLDNSATNFVLTSQSISNAIVVPALSFSFPIAATVTPVDGTLAANHQNLATNNLALSTPWKPGAALWLIWSINFYGQGAGQGYAIDNLSFSAGSPATASVTTPLSIASSSLRLTTVGGSTTALFSFTNTPGLSFSILATNKVDAPSASWPVVGVATENPAGSGQYQFSATNNAAASSQFYQLRQP